MTYGRSPSGRPWPGYARPGVGGHVLPDHPWYGLISADGDKYSQRYWECDHPHQWSGDAYQCAARHHATFGWDGTVRNSSGSYVPAKLNSRGIYVPAGSGCLLVFVVVVVAAVKAKLPS